ncbi:DUF6350 family protein [Phytoactinopolyspora halophila]|uniref:cell division protein PerM n=1 Tax=Phytoactinopolyspora halophila TaxID=1981511 RepID=UPI000F4DD480|nr:DUF6350 family protein [Phytoactinopolyspora halophila]
MPDLLTRPLLRRDEPAWGSRVPWFAAALASGWALIASASLSVLPAVAVWIGEGANAPLSDPLRFGARIWLLSHRIGLEVDGASIVLAPLGMTFMFVLLMYRSARWAAHQAGTATPRSMLAVIGPSVLVYVLGAVALAMVSTSGGITSSAVAAAGIAAAWALVGFGVGVVHETGFDEVWFARLSPEVRAALTGSAVVIAGLFVAGSVLVVVSTVGNTTQIGGLAEALEAGVLGNTALAAGSAAIMPNGVIWAASFSLGPGFAIGAETVVAPGGVQLGMLPAVPPLGALPSDVPGTLTWVVLAGPIVAGAIAGLLVYRTLEPYRESITTVVLAAGGTAAASALGMSALAMLSGGSMGAVRLAEVGPVPWEVAAMTFVACGVPAMITATLLTWLRSRRSASADAASARSSTPAD